MGVGTSRDARRHIKEWSDFFRDFGEVGADIVDEFIKRYKRRKYLRQSLRRLVDKGFILKRRDRFVVTRRGRKFFSVYNIKPVERFDGRWYLLSFDIPVKLDVKRDCLRRLLKRYNFFQLQKSVWVGTNALGEEAWEFIVENDLQNYCKPMIVEILEGDKELITHFKNIVRIKK